MTKEREIYAAPPSFRTMRWLGLAFLVLGGVLMARLAADDIALLWTKPVGVISVVPVLIGIMLGWVGLSETHMRRRLARLTDEGAQVGVHIMLPWSRVVRVERRGSGTYETLTLFPAGKREVRRPIPIGRAEGAPEEIVEDVMNFLRDANLTVTSAPAEGAREVWTVTAPADNTADDGGLPA